MKNDPIHFKENVDENSLEIYSLSSPIYFKGKNLNDDPIENTSDCFKADTAKTFSDTLKETISYIKNNYKISQTALSKKIVGIHESTLRSLKTATRTASISFNSLCYCYILHMLKDGNKKEEYVAFFDDEKFVTKIIENIDLDYYKRKIKNTHLSPLDKSNNLAEDLRQKSTSTTSNEYNTPIERNENAEDNSNITGQDNHVPTEHVPTENNENAEDNSNITGQDNHVPTEHVPTENNENAEDNSNIIEQNNHIPTADIAIENNENTEEKTNITEQARKIPVINDLTKYIKILLGDKYEVDIQRIELNRYFIIKYHKKTKNKSKTIVAIFLVEECKNSDKTADLDVWKKELEIIKETLNEADIFWFFHLEKTKLKKFEEYIQNVPELTGKTLIEEVKNDDRLRILCCVEKTRLEKELIQSANAEECNYNEKMNWFSMFTTTDSE